MKLQHQVCTSEQAFKLKELGITQKGANFAWQTFPAGAAFHFQYPIIYADKAHEYAAAFTLAELGIMLNCDTSGSPKPWSDDQYNSVEQFNYYKTEASLRAAVLLFSIEHGFISINEINERLKNA